MATRIRKLVEHGRDAAIEAIRELETAALAAEGRRSLKAKGKAAVAVGRKAAKAGLVVGAATAVGVVVREVRKRRKLAH